MNDQSSVANPGPTRGTSSSNSKKFDLKTITTWILLGLTVLAPVLVLPFTNNFVGQSKLFMAIWGALLTALMFFLRSFRRKVWEIVVSPISLPLLLFGASVLASTFFTQGYPVKNLLGFGGAYLAGILIALLGPSLISKDKAKHALKAVVIAGLVLTVASLLQLVGYGPSKLLQLITGIQMPEGLQFNIAGSSLVAAQVILIALVGQVAHLVINKKMSVFEMITLPLLTFGLGTHIWSLLPGQDAQLMLPPLAVSWSIALNTVEVPRAALIGGGPESYLSAFAQFKPAWLNTDNFWRLSFNSAAGYPLTLLVQLGFLGLIAWIFLAAKYLVQAKKHSAFRKSALTWMVGLSLVIQLVLPPNYVLVLLQGLLLAFWAAEFRDEFSTLKLQALSAKLFKNKDLADGKQAAGTDSFFSLVVNSVLIVGVLGLIFTSSKAYASFRQMFLANKALAQNNGVAVYDHQRKAVTLNPYLDSIRRSYAATNLQIAVALSNKADITDQEKQQVTQLIQQAVREGRAATTIDPTDYRNWMVLAQIYNNLVGSIEEAEQYAVTAYVNAIQAYPANPLLRIDLAQLLVNQEQLQQAANVLNQAINLKPDLPAGYFHLGRVLRAGRDLGGAKSAWQQALQLLDEESQDYTDLEAALGELETEIEQASAAAQRAQAGQQTGQGQTGQTQEGQTPLGQEVPSLTNQTLQESGSEALNNPSNEPLELSPESEQVINQTTQEEAEPQTETQE